MSSAVLIGRTFARYRIVERLGAGGMGEVFKAIDGVLQRPVALKILPSDVVRDEERLRRFVREAQSASALNHPNIVTIYDTGCAAPDDSDASEAVHYIAMELIEGQTLGARIRGGASLRTLLELIQQVADGLARAHAAGILHRDLKPDNIMVTHDGRAKIVDFGLAKPIQDERLGVDSPTVKLQHTREGVVLGTVGYMSPEQINGSVIDGRSDIFALGCVLYESITRRQPFVGEGALDTLHKIQHAPHVRPSVADPSLPKALDRIVDRCLAKDPEERYQSMKEVAVELRLLNRDLQRASAGLTSPISAEVLRPRRRQSLWIPIVAAGAVLAILAGAAMFTRRTDIDLSSYRFTPLQTRPEYEGSPSFSPDGHTVAYVADVDGVLQVFARSLEAIRGVQLTHSIEDCASPFWSPDGREVYYRSVAGAQDALWAVGAAGGTSRVVLENVEAAAISPDGKTLAFLRNQAGADASILQLWFASPPTAAPHAFTAGEFKNRTFGAGALRFSRDGSTLAAWLTVNTTGLPREFWLIDVRKLTARRALASLSDVPQPFPFEWMPDDRHIIFSGVHGSDQANGVHLWMADTTSDRVRALTASSGTEISPTVSPDGKTIVFAQEDLDFDVVKIPIGTPRLETVLSTARSERDPAWSPSDDGFSYVTNRSGTDEVWFRSTRGDWERPVATSRDFNDQTPTSVIFGSSFSPDGQRLAYVRVGNQTRLWVSPIGGGAAVPLGPELRRGDGYFGSPTWSPDASWIAFVDHGPPRDRLMKMGLAVNSAPVVVMENITSDITRWSPNGQWLTAATADGFYVVSPDGSVKRRISDAGWLMHAWSPDSSAIYGVRLDDNMHLTLRRVALDGTEGVIVDLGVSPPSTVPLDGFNLSPDGKTLIAGLLKPKGDLWILQGFENETSWWQRLFALKEPSLVK